MKAPDELAKLLRQRTWDKEVALWVGSESALHQLIGPLPTTTLDLLDLFDEDKLPMDDDETRQQLSSALAARLQAAKDREDDLAGRLLEKSYDTPLFDPKNLKKEFTDADARKVYAGLFQKEPAKAEKDAVQTYRRPCDLHEFISGPAACAAGRFPTGRV